MNNTRRATRVELITYIKKIEKENKALRELVYKDHLFNNKDKKVLLKLVCDDAQKQTNLGKEVTKEMFDLRYKLRDSF